MRLSFLPLLFLLSLCLSSGQAAAQITGGIPIEEDCLLELGIVEGAFRFRSNLYEYYNGCSWQTFATSAGSACLAATASVMQFNTTAQTYEYCGNTGNWRQFSKTATATACSKTGEIGYDTVNKRYNICTSSGFYSYIQCAVDADCVP